MDGDQEKMGKFWLIVILAVILVGVGVGYFVFTKKSPGGSKSVADISWEITDGGNYKPSKTPPSCPSPLNLQPPTDLSKVVSVLYPGQTRGGDYKPHGGLRFADGANEAIVTAPLDASIMEGSRYLEGGEIQYLFDFVNACGIKYRFDHLRTLSAPLAELAEKFPDAKVDDSRTTAVNPPVKVKTGDIIATTVGFLTTGNAGFDFGVYDLRKFNEASKSATFRSAQADDPGLAWHALCWFDLFSAENEAIIRNLPSTDPNSQSDYCK